MRHSQQTLQRIICFRKRHASVLVLYLAEKNSVLRFKHRLRFKPQNQEKDSHLSQDSCKKKTAIVNWVSILINDLISRIGRRNSVFTKRAGVPFKQIANITNFMNRGNEICFRVIRSYEKAF